MDTKMCDGKIRYANQMEAYAGAAKKSVKYNKNEPPRAYFCPNCGGWHITYRPLDQYAVNMRLKYGGY